MKPSPEHSLLLCIAGPTASGKTALAIDLAHRYGTEILSADARQFYREMSIGTAKPTAAELKSVPHHFIDFLSVTDDYNIGRFEQDALKRLDELFLTLAPQVAGRDASAERPGLVEGRIFAPDTPVWGELVEVRRAGEHLFLRYAFPSGRS